jgi:Golgi nucleoside diphosphatase
MTDEYYSYGCVIDAGSSGSRIHIYQWSSPTSPITKYSSYESSPGISIPDVGLSVVVELISLAESSLPDNVDLSTIPIFLGATAGMRILDPATEASIMSQVRSLLHSSGFMFRNEWARTISGEEEGAFGWLVANHLKNGGIPGEKSDTTYGAIDLGGASVQISFRPDGAILAHLYPVRLDKMEYSLYTHSYLYYGVDQAISKFNEHNLDELSPCYPVGYTDIETGISGTGAWHDCMIKVAGLFDFTYDCHHGDAKIERCSFNGVYQPPIRRKRFIAMSAFGYTWDFLGLNIGPETDDLKTMIKKAQKICSLSYEEQIKYYNELSAEMSPERRTTDIHTQCFKAAYIYHLVHSGFGLPSRRTPIEIYHHINGTDVDWALGMMLVERNKGSCETSGQRSTILKISGPSGIDSSDYKLLFISITPTCIIIACILGYMLVRTRRKYRTLEMRYLYVDQSIQMTRRMA